MKDRNEKDNKAFLRQQVNVTKWLQSYAEPILHTEENKALQMTSLSEEKLMFVKVQKSVWSTWSPPTFSNQKNTKTVLGERPLLMTSFNTDLASKKGKEHINFKII